MPSLLPFKFLFQKNLLFSEFNFSAVCVDKNEFVQVRILTLGADLHYIALCIWWGFEYVALASKVIFWEHSRKICLELEVFQVYTVTLSQWLVTQYFYQKLLYKTVLCIVLL